MRVMRRRMKTCILLGISVAISQPSNAQTVSALTDELQNLFVNANEPSIRPLFYDEPPAVIGKWLVRVI